MTLQSLLDRFDLLMDTPESASRIRRFILRLAVEGQLTKQKEVEESAHSLLERVQSRKKQLLAENDSPRRKSLGDMPSEFPFDLPENWAWTRLDDVSPYIQRGKRPDYSEREKIPVVSQKCVQWDGFKSDRVRFIDPDSLNKYQSYRFLREGDLLWNSTGVGTVGRINIYRGQLDEYRRAVADSHVTIVRPIKNMVLPEYIYCWIASTHIQDKIETGMTSGTTKQTELNTSTVRKTLLPLPPLEEQQRIVETVDGLMDECDALEQQQERERTLQVQVGTAVTGALQSADDAESLRPAWERVRGHFDTVTATTEGIDALRQTILQLAVQGRLTERDSDDKPAGELVQKSSTEIQELYDSGRITKPSERPPVRGEDKVFDLPKKWIWTRLGNVLALVNGRAYKKSELLDKGTPVIRIQNLTGGGSWYYTDLDLPPEKYCNAGDLLYTWSGTFGPHIWDGGKAVFHYHIWRIELTAALAKRFAYYLLQAISADVEEDAHGIMLPHMTKGGMEKHPVPLPPLAEQKRIVETLDRLLPLFDRLSKSVSEKSKRGRQFLEAALRDASVDPQGTVLTNSIT